LLVATKLLTAKLHSRHGVGVANFAKVEVSRTFHLRLNNPE